MTLAFYFRIIHKRNALLSMEVSFFDSVRAWFRGVAVSNRRAQDGTLMLKLIGR
jgi:hypothetical protein